MSDIAISRWLVAQIGARRHYAVPRALARAGLLERLVTDLHADHPIARVFSAVPEQIRTSALRSILSRQIDGVPLHRVHCHPWLALRRVLRKSRRESPAEMYCRWARDNGSFNELVVRDGFGNAAGVYVFNGAGLEILERAREQGLKTVVDQTDAPFLIEEQLVQAERERWPGWERGSVSRCDWEPLAVRERKEWDLADAILCGSEYVAEGVRAAGGPVERCRVVPYGYDMRTIAVVGKQLDAHRELHVLYAGTLCLRKGIPYFAEAAHKLRTEPVRFRAIGTSVLADNALNTLRQEVEFRGSVPRAQMSDQFSWADVLVLPTISEGSANVCYEALAHGVPVITTPNAGSVVRDGHEGFLVPIRDVDALVERVRRLACDRELLQTLSLGAAARAREFTWSDYAARLTAVLESLDDSAPRSLPPALAFASIDADG